MEKSILWNIIKKYGAFIGDERKNVYVVDGEKEVQEGKKAKDLFNQMMEMFSSEDVYGFTEHPNPLFVMTFLSERKTRDEFRLVSPRFGLEVYHSTREFINTLKRSELLFELYDDDKIVGYLVPGILEPECAKDVALEEKKRIVGLSEDMEKFVIHFEGKKEEISLDEFMKKYTIKPAVSLPSEKLV